MKLQPRFVEKPWGRTRLPSVFEKADDRCIGEIWFSAPDGAELPLLIKYIFTSERLSIQVHPDDDQARLRGLRHGKSECWYVIEAEPGALIGLGLKRATSREALQAAALDGTVEDLINWLPVKAGDFFNVPAGTVHAIGAGVSLLEVQQNIDVTYRLYDYGRPRELHLHDAVAVASLKAQAPFKALGQARSVKSVLIDEPHFSLVRVQEGSPDAEKLAQRDRWLIPLVGSVSAEGELCGVGGCLFAPAGTRICFSPDALLLMSSAGPLSQARRIAA
jgi:mannose-6-phosphate isomerase